MEILGTFMKRLSTARGPAIGFGIALSLCFAPLVLSAADWPQWRGPQRNGLSQETGLLAEWPNLRQRFILSFPHDLQPEIEELYRRLRTVWINYMRGQILLMLIVGVVFTLAWFRSWG